MQKYHAKFIQNGQKNSNYNIQCHILINSYAKGQVAHWIYQDIFQSIHIQKTKQLKQFHTANIYPTLGFGGI